MNYPLLPPLGILSKKQVVRLCRQRLTLHIRSINRFHWLFFGLIISDQHPVSFFFFPSFFKIRAHQENKQDLRLLKAGMQRACHFLFHKIFFFCIYFNYFLKKSRFGGELKAASTNQNGFLCLHSGKNRGKEHINNGWRPPVLLPYIKNCKCCFFSCHARWLSANQMHGVLLLSRSLRLSWKKRKCIYNITCIKLTVPQN